MCLKAAQPRGTQKRGLQNVCKLGDNCSFKDGGDRAGILCECVEGFQCPDRPHDVIDFPVPVTRDPPPVVHHDENGGCMSATVSQLA